MPERLNAEKSDWLISAVYMLFSAMALFFVWLSAVNFAEHSSLLTVLPYAAASLTCVAMVIWFPSRVAADPKQFGAILFIAAFVLKSAFALALNTQPESDFYLLYTAAEKLASGVNTMPETAYFQNWPYQSAYVVWMAFFMKVFGAGLTFFKLTNCLFSAATTFLIYLLSRRFASERGARSAAVAFMLYPGTFLLVHVLTNQHLSEFLLLLSVYVYTRPTESIRQKAAMSAAAGVLLAFCNAVRPIGIVVILSVFTYLILRFILWIRTRRRELGQLALRSAVVITVYFLAGAALSGLVKATDLNEYGLVNNVPEWKFIVGLNEKYTGVYNDEDEKAVFGACDNRKQAVQALLDERLSILERPGRFLSLAYRKTQIMWGEFEPTYWAFTQDARNALSGRIAPESLDVLLYRGVKFTAFIYMWLYLLMSVGVVNAVRQKRASEAIALFMLVALIYFFMHLFIEVQTRYRSLMVVTTFPLIALGVDAVCETGTKFGRIRA